MPLDLIEEGVQGSYKVVAKELALDLGLSFAAQQGAQHKEDLHDVILADLQ